MESSAAITVTELTVMLEGHTIIDNVSFTVPAGETTAIIGPNGAGKSVLLKSMLGLIPAAHGTVSILETENTSLARIAPRLSYIPQSLKIDPAFPLTIAGLFSLKSPRMVGATPAEAERMSELLALVGMKGREHLRLATLSGGQLQRILLAYSLVSEPELLLLDEPSAGVDTHGQESLYALLERIQSERQLTLLLVSHELDIVMRYANHVLCLNQSLLCEGLPSDVLTGEMLTEMYGHPVRHFDHQHKNHG